MADTLIPLNAPTGGDPKYAARAARQTLVGVPLSGATAARPLGARSGVRPGTPTWTVTVTLSGSTPSWVVYPHAGVIDTQSAIAGPYEYAFDAQKTGTLAAQDGSNARVDLVCVLPSDTDEDQSGDRKVDIVTVTGTANGSLTPPAAPARAMVLARVNVPKAGSGAAPTVTWVAPFLSAAGGVMAVDTLANLKLITGHLGQFATVFGDATTFNNGLYQWNSATNRWDTASSPSLLMNWGTANGGTAWASIAGFQPILQMGQFGGPLSSGAIGKVTLPKPFPNGFAFAVLSPHRDSNIDTDAPPFMQQTGASKSGFEFFVPNKAGATVFVPWLAIGW